MNAGLNIHQGIQGGLDTSKIYTFPFNIFFIELTDIKHQEILGRKDTIQYYIVKFNITNNSDADFPQISYVPEENQLNKKKRKLPSCSALLF